MFLYTFSLAPMNRLSLFLSKCQIIYRIRPEQVGSGPMAEEILTTAINNTNNAFIFGMLFTSNRNTNYKFFEGVKGSITLINRSVR